MLWTFEFREEIQNLAKENEQLEDSLKDANTNYITEKKNKGKVDRILYDAGEAIKLMLKVYMFNILKASLCIQRSESYLKKYQYHT